MKRRTLLQSLPAVAFLPAADWLALPQEKPASAQSTTPVYELRVYHTFEGKLDDLLRRFREHTIKLFEKQGIKHVNLAIMEPAGPKHYKLSKEADVTVLLYKRRKVEANHAFKKGDLNEKALESILADLSKITTKR